MRQVLKNNKYIIIFILSLVSLIPIGNGEMFINLIIPKTLLVKELSMGTFHIDNIIGMIFFISLIISFRKIHSKLKKEKSKSVYILYSVILLCLVLHTPTKNEIIKYRDGFQTIELIQKESQISYAVDSVGLCTIEGKIILKNYSRKPLIFRAVLRGSNFVYLTPENDIVPDIILRTEKGDLIELLPNEKYEYKLEHKLDIKMTNKQALNGTLNRIAIFEIYDSNNQMRNLGYKKGKTKA